MNAGNVFSGSSSSTTTNRLRLSLTIIDQTLPFLRFSSLHLKRFCVDLDALLLLISRSELYLKSVNLSDHKSIPANGLRALSKKFPTLTSLACARMGSLTNSDLLLIADCFPLLEELDIRFPKSEDGLSVFGIKALSLALPKLRKVNLKGSYFLDDPSVVSFCKNCEFLEEVSISCYSHVTEAGIVCAIRERPGLRSISVCQLNLVSSVTSDFIGSVVSLKSLTCLQFYFARISDEFLCSVPVQSLPLRKLVLNNCYMFSYQGIFSLLSKCQFIQHLELEDAELSVFLRNLMSINLSECSMPTNSACFELARNCPLLNEMKMEYTAIGKKGIEEYSLMGCSIIL